MAAGGKGTLNAHNGHRQGAKKLHYSKQWYVTLKNKAKRVLQSSGVDALALWKTTYGRADKIQVRK